MPFISWELQKLGTWIFQNLAKDFCTVTLYVEISDKNNEPVVNTQLSASKENVLQFLQSNMWHMLPTSNSYTYNNSKEMLTKYARTCISCVKY